MGWKSVKDHYQIKHLVSVRGTDIVIGSGYIPDIIVIDQTGQLIKRNRFGSNDELARYQREMDADPETLKRLVAAVDQFKADITVYTYKGGEVLEAKCEVPGWPNTTHDGELMYENAFHLDKQVVIQWAKANARAEVNGWITFVQKTEQDLKESQEQLAQKKDNLERLDHDYPDPTCVY
jgi:hypothetical protein